MKKSKAEIDRIVASLSDNRPLSEKLLEANQKDVERLEAELYHAINERNEAWKQLREAGIDVRPPTMNEAQ
jgi:uncharacterized protein (UPF0335 family)